ncbi:hypothetical protein [Loktanella sp. SALINAS62]|uniref:hypothetical protein n=1 Tax=Loktanella sp. SALINAS62 TaxID=2706124 RepID=UPI001B8C9906|nr:hypothetical protein [Loktanella sp. SALINAS62]MBS1303531.1 hypothetical protein [Loktanella sp. SALINAS62]
MNKTLALLTLILTAAFAASPLFVSFSGFDASQLPVPQVDPPIQPAGYAFAIWGLIYVWLLISAGYGVLKRPQDPAWQAVRWPLCGNLAVGVPWLWIANQSPVWATVTIWIMLILAIVALVRSPSQDRLYLRAPVGLYAGWLTAASFVSLGTVLAGYDIVFGAYGWAYIGILTALLPTVAVYFMVPSPAYLIAVIWALAGICAANGVTNFMVTATAVSGIAVLLCVMAIYTPTRPIPTRD